MKMQNDNAESARQLFKNGQLRKAITQYRHALRFETDAFARAQIYLELTRIYRITVRMKNARLELKRAFAAIGLEWSRNTLWWTLTAYLARKKEHHLHSDFEKRTPHEKGDLLADLYEEMGLSAYYLRQNFILLQSIIRSEAVCKSLGPSRALLNWYGGSACVMALIGFKKQSLKLIRKCDEISHHLQLPRDHGKSLIWKALLYDYHGFPVRSAELFETCLKETGTQIDPYDLRLTVLTLSINYLVRGHFEKSVEVLEKLSQYNSCFQDTLSGLWIDSASWYTLGAAAYLNKIPELQPKIHAFRSILSADRDEKWLLTQFLGHLLIAARKLGMDPAQVEDLIKRFKILGMSPKKTHFESSFYWMAQAYARYDLALKDRKHLGKFKRALRRLAQTPSHPTMVSHHSVLKAALAALEDNKSVYAKWNDRAAKEARAIDNQWALRELQGIKNQMTGAQA